MKRYFAYGYSSGLRVLVYRAFSRIYVMIIIINYELRIIKAFRESEPMNYDILSVNFFPVTGCAFLYLFIWRNSDLEKIVKNIFYYLISICLIELATFNLENILLSTDCDKNWMVLVTCAGYILRPLMLYLFILLVLRNDHRIRIKQLLVIPLIIDALFAVSAFFTDIAYSYGADKVFRRGPLGWFSHIIMIFYLITLVVLSITQKVKKQRFEGFVILMSAIMLTMGAFMESILSNLVVMRVAIVSTLFFYYMFFQTQIYKDDMAQKKLEQAQRLEKLSVQVVTALAGTVDAKDSYTNGHSRRVAEYSEEISRRLGMDEEFCKNIYFMGLLHDIGKIGIPDNIINKSGKLTDEEYEIIKTHPVIGSEVLKKITEMPNLYCGARWHHEHFDGKGYPDGISGDEIPIEARIIAVADAYDAMSSKRSYRNALPQDKIRAEIVRVRGTQLDPKIADVMIGMIDEDTGYKMKE